MFKKKLITLFLLFSLLAFAGISTAVLISEYSTIPSIVGSEYVLLDNSSNYFKATIKTLASWISGKTCVLTEAELMAAEGNGAVTQIELLQPINLTASRTITKDLYLADSATITTTGYIFTIQGHLYASISPHFLGSGTIVFGGKFGGEVSPFWWGATGDGTTDDTDAIQAAITAAGTVGGSVVYFPRGTYKITSALANSADSITLLGGNRFGTLIKQFTTNAKCINNTGDYFNLSGLSFIYNSTPVSGGTAIYSSGNYCLFDKFAVRSAYVGIELITGVAQKLTQFEILNYESVGLYAHSINDVFVSQFIMNAGNTTRGALGGIRLVDKCEAFMASDGDILLGQYSLTTNASVYSLGVRPAYNKFSSVYFDSAALRGVFINNSVEFEFSNCWFSGGRSVTGYAGVYLAVSDNIRFRGGELFNCGGNGMIISADAINTLVDGMSVNSNSVTAGSGVAHGISVSANAEKFTITNCNISNGLYTGTQGYGVFISSGTSDHYTIKNNMLLGNATGAISDSGTGTDVIIRDNIGYNPIGSAAITVSSSPFTHTAGHSEETIYIYGGIVSDVTTSSTTVAAASPAVVQLGPNEAVTVTYSLLPTMKKVVH